MDVSKDRTPEGLELLEAVIGATGLPSSLLPKAEQELHTILAAGGQHPGDVTLDGLREALLLYLEELALAEEAAEAQAAGVHPEV